MSNIDKQAVQTVADLKAGYTLGHADVAILNELARIALASLEAEPVGEVSEQRDGLVMDGTVDLGGASTHRIIKGASKMKRLPLGTKFYAAPPAPVSVPAAMEIDDDFDSAFEHGKAVGWNAYRAAMLQAEPVSNSDELPLDYLQGHKDGLEWAAQLAEANHPQTGDWLYDDPIDLARAIRKGPDMPTVQGGNYPVTPDGWISCSERMPEKGQNVLISVNFDSSLVEPLICSARYTGSTFRRGDATIKPGNDIEQATHWMPLPSAPQQEA
ncbi:DUF551 domain-containing protein [Escherichia coli]|nr:DUF551 domain-containing protein [Escherichia coli]EFH4490234.1 DUF551 domain-containing protein [Escherichia coli]EFL7051787.1 DUF551 domain-containing protein [Escherichia coli]EFN3837907.1 DUF551 domain-containing protein [Escherichia coli]EFN3891320.1 DUF551 domain-containing protein [Escherichia coli]